MIVKHNLYFFYRVDVSQYYKNIKFLYTNYWKHDDQLLQYNIINNH